MAGYELLNERASQRTRVPGTLDRWLEEQHRAPTASIHDLLTHVVDEVSLVCQTVQECMSAADYPAPPAEAAQ